MVNYGKLWQRIENGSRCIKKRKNGKDNRVCGKNEEDTGKSKSSIKKSTERDEVISGQRKKES